MKIHRQYRIFALSEVEDLMAYRTPRNDDGSVRFPKFDTREEAEQAVLDEAQAHEYFTILEEVDVMGDD
jgi:hypothetical protein